jgi:hypothetical protein
MKINNEEKESIRKSFLNGKLFIESMDKDTKEISWKSISEVMKHHTAYKNILRVNTDKAAIGVTEDHSLFSYDSLEPIKTSDLKVGDMIVGKDDSNKAIPLEIDSVVNDSKQEFTYDISVPGDENFFTESGILAHNSYSISGVSLDIEKSSKYQSMKDSFENEYDKLLELAKRSIKIVVGLKQPRYSVGISSALGPLSKPGTMSRRNFAGGARGGWS